ncbi:TrkA family potassium uptake protein [Malonomonas rubra]|uniref:potassium channel family protein n=1 Tax=Malonomonas rubra TaxID=57040 RepID=UPI0026EB44C0|nr:potassium channel protein [Malonomonas rubra]
MDPLRKVLLSLLILVILIGGGTIGYVIIEDWSTFEALYMTVITLATVGYREVHDLSHEGQVFTIVLIIFGAGNIAYAIGSMIQFMVEGQLRKLMGRKKLQKQIGSLKNHYIVCGFGRIGRLVSREFASKPIPFIVVEQDAERCQNLEDAGYLFVQGDATNDAVLERAGIDRANGLITVVTSDSANVFITLTARGINPNLFILARASEDGADIKLMRAGANKVVSPYTIGATRIAQAILRPSVVDFIDIATGTENIELQLEEIRIAEKSTLAGKTLVNSGLRKDLGLIIVGIKRHQKMTFNPDPTTEIEVGDILITLGEPGAIKNMEHIAYGAI